MAATSKLLYLKEGLRQLTLRIIRRWLRLLHSFHGRRLLATQFCDLAEGVCQGLLYSRGLVSHLTTALTQPDL